MFAKLLRYIKHPSLCLSVFLTSRVSRLLSDECFIKLQYYLVMRKGLNLKNPQTFNEKLQWLKLHDHNPQYTHMVDKYEAKKIAATIIGSKHIIPTLGVWEQFEDIDFDQLPNQFVLKCTHDSGGLVICKDKSTLDMNMAREKLNSSLHRNYFYVSRELPYKNVKPRIIAEKYMVDESGFELKDYKFFCFNGEVKALFILRSRATDPRLDFYDAQFNHLPFFYTYMNADKSVEKPLLFDNMLNIAQHLSKGFSFVRVDLYSINGVVYFGEYTFCPGAGLGKFEPVEWDNTLGSYLELPEMTR